MRVTSVIAALFLSSLGSVAQTAQAQEFEVATVKPFDPTPTGGGGFRMQVLNGPGTSDPGRIEYINYNLRRLFMFAFDLKRYRISGPDGAGTRVNEPVDWLDSNSARFVIEAKIRPGATQPQVNEMLQNLLTDRFKMTVHREAREFALNELVVAKNGPKLKESVDDASTDGPPRRDQLTLGRSGGSVTKGRMRFRGRGIPISALVDFLVSPTHGPVLDKTGLTGTYDISLEYGYAIGGAEADPTAPDLKTALQEQLGLKLEPKKGPIDMLVIDHIEKAPTEN